VINKNNVLRLKVLDQLDDGLWTVSLWNKQASK